MSKALGILETRGMASLMGATDAMLKAADVSVKGRHGIGSGWVTVVVEGDVAAVKTARYPTSAPGALLACGSASIARPPGRCGCALQFQDRRV